jgi:hypothetical protein
MRPLTHIRPAMTGASDCGLLKSIATGHRPTRAVFLVNPRAQTGHHRSDGNHAGTGETYYQYARSYGRDQIN